MSEMQFQHVYGQGIPPDSLGYYDSKFDVNVAWQAYMATYLVGNIGCGPAPDDATLWTIVQKVFFMPFSLLFCNFPLVVGQGTKIARFLLWRCVHGTIALDG